MTCKTLSLPTRGQVYVIYVRSAMLHASECWPIKSEDLSRLQRNERAMLRWMLNFRVQDHTSCSHMYNMLQIPTLESILTTHRLHWYGHTERSNRWINKIRHLEVDGYTGRGRPQKRWYDVVSADIKKWKLNDQDPLDRTKWRGHLQQIMAKSNPS